MMEALSSSETSVLTRSTLRNIPEDGLLEVFVCFVSGFIIEITKDQRLAVPSAAVNLRASYNAWVA
jgi:hypothetical protein